MGASPYFVHVLASGLGDTLCVGVTNDLTRRTQEHRQGEVAGITKKYGVNRLFPFEAFDDVNEAIAREKRLEKWNRAWKVQLIKEQNPNWDDLDFALTGGVQ